MPLFRHTALKDRIWPPKWQKNSKQLHVRFVFQKMSVLPPWKEVCKRRSVSWPNKTTDVDCCWYTKMFSWECCDIVNCIYSDLSCNPTLISPTVIEVFVNCGTVPWTIGQNNGIIIRWSCSVRVWQTISSFGELDIGRVSQLMYAK